LPIEVSHLAVDKRSRAGESGMGMVIRVQSTTRVAQRVGLSLLVAVCLASVICVRREYFSMHSDVEWTSLGGSIVRTSHAALLEVGGSVREAAESKVRHSVALALCRFSPRGNQNG
jgi:hypothetical protein